MQGFTPFLQIIHISDLHVTDPTTQTAASARILIRRLRKFLPRGLVNKIDDGILPHDPLAVDLFKDFIADISTHDPQWSKCITWLVDTGDLSSLGDTDSLDLGLRYWNDLAQTVTASASIYGNHDAWPGAFPLFANFSDLVKQPQVLISRNFTVAMPNLALQTPIPHGATAHINVRCSAFTTPTASPQPCWLSACWRLDDQAASTAARGLDLTSLCRLKNRSK